ncbi:MAG: hypothetical protein MI923_02630 [Phycisphaerales bacterium]|nr:hypothetical protein [Phycisphaerales bacterium]
MALKPQKNIADVAREIGRYSLDAFEFLHQGLDHSVQKLHGPPDPMLLKLCEWMEAKKIDPTDLERLVEAEKVPEPVADAIEHFGGPEALRQKLNRHVSGGDLCWGLRDLALQHWGLMAPAVLRCWGIRSTMDFGQMVFALVNNGLLQKQPEDRIEDFDNVFDFDTAFDSAYKITSGSN